MDTQEKSPKSPDEDDKKLSCWNKSKIIFTNITVEPLMLCYILPSVMANLAIQNLNLEKACRVDLRYNNETCDALALRNSSGYKPIEEIEVQRLVASMAALRNVFQSVFPCLLLLFLGSWSDRHRRRLPCITLPIFGEITAMVGFLICTYFFYELPILANAIAEGLPGLTGGWTAMCLGANAYVSDISSLETRTLRLGALILFTNISVPVGIALSGVLFLQIGFYGVFSLSCFLLTVGMIYGILRVKEAPRKDADVAVVCKKGFFRDFFDYEHIKDTFQVAFKPGARNRRKRICVIMVLVMLVIGPLHGEMTVLYLFVRYKFLWNEIDFSMYLTFHFVIQTLGTTFSLLFLSKYLKLDDSVVGVLAAVSKVLSCLMYAYAPSTVYFYIGAVLDAFQGTSFIAMRAIISKLVPPEELGKIYSLFGVSEALMPLVYGPMYSMVYKATIHVLPSTFFIVGAILTSPCIFIFWWLYSEHKKDLLEAIQDKTKLPEKETLLSPNSIVIIKEGTT